MPPRWMGKGLAGLSPMIVYLGVWMAVEGSEGPLWRFLFANGSGYL